MEPWCLNRGMKMPIRNKLHPWSAGITFKWDHGEEHTFSYILNIMPQKDRPKKDLNE